MIDVAAIDDALGSLTGEATKVGIALACLGTAPIRADKPWCSRLGRRIGMTGDGVRKALKELHKEGLVHLVNRVHLVPASASLSHPPCNLARVSPVDRDVSVDQNDESREPADTTCDTGSGSSSSPPWLRQAERSEGQGRGGVLGGVASSTDGRDVKIGDHSRVVAAIHEMFRDVNDGATPTWGAKQGLLVKRLLKAHSSDEVIRRARIMFYERRSWPRPPYDVGTLSAHFDKFARSTTAGGTIGKRTMGDPDYYGKVDDV